MTLTLRPFAPADQAAARALILAGLGERFGYIDESRNPDLDDIAASFLAQGHAFLVVESAGAIVGTGALLFEPDGATCQLVRVSVRRDLRRQGIAQAIVAALLAEARAQGRRRVWMETNQSWRDAIALLHVPRIVLRWSPWLAWEHVARNVRDGGVRLPHAPGVHEAKYADADERLTIGKASSLRMRVKQGLVRGKAPHAAGTHIRPHEDTARIVVRWAETERPAAAEEELHRRRWTRFEQLPHYTFF